MEPLAIELKNFTAFADERLELGDVRLAAIVGQNGAGKSSLLDGLVFALYGESTKGGTRAIDNHVRRGETECRVAVEFCHGDGRYRVIRHRSAGKGKTLLELYRATEDGQWEPMSGKTVTDTQAQIESLLRMDYRTFTASSLILQGKADSLTADMTDAERKEVLARILGLDLWDRLQERARERARNAKAEARVLGEQAVRAEQNAARRYDVTAAIATQEQALATAEAEVQEASSRVADLEAQVRQRPVLEGQVRDLNGQITARQQDRQQAEADQAAADQEIAQQEELLKRRAHIETDLAAAVPAAAEARRLADERQATVTELQARAQAAGAVEQQLAAVERMLAAREADKQQVAADGRQVNAQLKQHQELLAQADLIRQAAANADTLSEQLADLDARAEKHATLAQRCTELEARVAAWDRDHEHQVDKLTEAIDQAQQQAGLLGDVPCQGTDLQPQCMLLAAAHKAAGELETLQTQLAEVQARRNPHIEAWQAAVRERDALLYSAGAHADIRRALASAQPRAQQFPLLEAAEQQVHDLKGRLQELSQRYRGIEQEIAELKEQRERLAGEIAGVADLRRQLAQQQEALADLRARADAARDRVARLQQARDEAIAGESAARQRIEQLRQRHGQLADRIRTLDTEVANLQARKTEAEQALAAIDQVAADLATAQADLTAARQREAEAREALGRLRAELAEVERAAKEAGELRTRVAAAERQALVYETLDAAAGKKAGVPALIIEAAVPQIEALANDLLGRMAGGRLSVRLDTQAEGKSTGTMQEVLRITVLDGGQDRPYQTFSGAERFMVDLALRIAISKFLAHRAGAEIRLLVVDEGIGCADPVNRQSIMEAITEAAKEFSRVLVVSHIPEFSDAFPQRIEVSRGPDGSQVRVVA